MPPIKLELSGAAGSPLIHLAPANGFPPQVYSPMLSRLGDCRIVSLPPRALWDDGPPPSDRRGWRQTADDLLAGLTQHDLHDIIAIGHSFGGIASMLALIDEPARFRALIMLDPVLLPQFMIAEQARAWADGSIKQHPMVRSALRRRRVFAGREDAFRRFREKPVFADWADESLRLYVEHGLRPRAAGDGYGLRWDVAWEAYYFSAVYEHVWRDLPKANGLAPILIVRADDSHTFPDECVAQARALLPAGDFIELPDQGHLFPLAAPEMTATLIVEWLASLWRAPGAA